MTVTAGIATNPTTINDMTHHRVRSIEMYTMHEALARDRMRDEQRRSQKAQLAREVAAERRWHRVSLRANAAQARHARRVQRLHAR
jgi:hypothetical protein